jgi:predicted nuclease of predicted toxin-antitoxin system
MRFLVDECTGPVVAQWLRSQSHDVFSVYDEARGMPDEGVLAEAFSGGWILITNDKDFEEMVFRERKPHHGVVFLRLQDERAASKIDAIRRLPNSYADRLPDAFVVVAETQIRFAAQPPGQNE